MEWRDEGVLLAVRKHGETAAIIEILTSTHGRHLGVVRGATSRKIAPMLQLGAQVQITWRARLDDHLGAYTVELLKARAAEVMDEPLALAGLSSILALAAFVLPEREPDADTYARTLDLLDALAARAGWLPELVYWELALLQTYGFGLDLSRCAATGATADLAFVSPRTGRAVSAGAAGTWASRLLPLPKPLLLGGPMTLDDVRAGLDLTGYFLRHHLAPSLGGTDLPPARQRFIDRLGRA